MKKMWYTNVFFSEKNFKVKLPIQTWRFSNLQKVNFRTSHPRCSMKKVFLNILENSQENTCVQQLYYKRGSNTEFCEIFKSTFFTKHFSATASLNLKLNFQKSCRTIVKNNDEVLKLAKFIFYFKQLRFYCWIKLSLEVYPFFFTNQALISEIGSSDRDAVFTFS